MKDYYVYFLTNKTNEVLYVGFTNNIERRLAEHTESKTNGFSHKYRTFKLVYVEVFSNPNDAIAREKQIKNWRRSKKNFLIKQQNPEWLDLSQQWYQPEPSASLGMTGEQDS